MLLERVLNVSEADAECLEVAEGGPPAPGHSDTLAPYRQQSLGPREQCYVPSNLLAGCGKRTMAEKALILIPDISGYTDFSSTTEIDHAAHIIAELLEVMIKAENTA